MSKQKILKITKIILKTKTVVPEMLVVVVEIEIKRLTKELFYFFIQMRH